MKKLRVSEHNEFGVVRYTLHNGEQLFAGTDIVKSLGLTNNTMLIDCIEPDDKCELEVNENDIERKVTMINLCGVQSLISSCRMNTKTDTRAFKKWLIKDIGYRSMKEMELSGSDKFILDAIHKAYSKPEVKATTPEPVAEMVVKTEPEEKLYSRTDIRNILGVDSTVLKDCLTNDLKWVAKMGYMYKETAEKGYGRILNGHNGSFRFTEVGFNIIKETISKKFNNVNTKEKDEFDLTGMKFGKLTVEGIVNDGKKMYMSTSKWKCKCECGNTSTPMRTSLINGKSKSCGKCIVFNARWK
ncbi:MAG: hypothetical protein MJ126_04685 [Lachnospiraceae bacterium]|nr:hypothetical protein [Lachnospiraceae bacterium]